MPNLVEFLDQRIRTGDAGEVAARVEQSKYTPSKKLSEDIAKLIKVNVSTDLLRWH